MSNANSKFPYTMQIGDLSDEEYETTIMHDMCGGVTMRVLHGKFEAKKKLVDGVFLVEIKGNTVEGRKQEDVKVLLYNKRSKVFSANVAYSVNEEKKKIFFVDQGVPTEIDIK